MSINEIKTLMGCSRSLFVKLHNIVVGNSADGTLLTPTSTRDASSHMTTGYESGVTLVFVAQFAHLGASRQSGSIRQSWIGYFHGLLLVALRLVMSIMVHLIFIIFHIRRMLVFTMSIVSRMSWHRLSLDLMLIEFSAHSCSTDSLVHRVASPVWRPLVNDRQTLQAMDVRTFNYKDCAADFEDVANSKRLKGTLFSFSTQSEPSSVR
jgi:hypothetical protein